MGERENQKQGKRARGEKKAEKIKRESDNMLRCTYETKNKKVLKDREKERVRKRERERLCVW